MKKNFKKLNVNLIKSVNDSYPIIISLNIDIGEEIKKTNLSNNYAVITDDKIYKLYKNKIETEFNKQGLNYKFIVFKNGEKSKNLKIFSYISEKLLKNNFDRKSAVIALGGGVAGDMAGYVAGTFMRGIPFIQIPTTLLSMVDSSIGGKVAVDLKQGKNSSGLFYQPKKVIIDINFLNTLSDEEYFNGIFEIIKHGIIRDKKYFDYINDNIDKIKNRDNEVLIELIYQSVIIKSKVVEKDEKESDLRQILNFGHTIGHAIETLSKFKLKHGFAIGLGMIIESQIAVKNKLLNNNEFNKIKELIQNFNVKEYNYTLTKLINIMKYDKKNIKDKKKQLFTFIQPVKIGKVEIKKYSEEEIINFLKK